MSKVKCIATVDNFKRGNYYEIFIEFDDSYWIYDGTNDEIKFWKNPKHRNYKFSDYFDDIQKSRNEKLKKLYEQTNNNS